MTAKKKPEPAQVVKLRRDQALAALTAAVPYSRLLDVSFERRGDELTSVMAFSDDKVGNPMLPALHGGATAAFLELTAIIGLSWSALWPMIESGEIDPGTLDPVRDVRLPKTIDFTVDYLRTGLPRDAYARAKVARAGRRYASVHVESWQDNSARPFAQGSGHFLMPGDRG